VERVRQLLDPHREALVAKAVQLALAGDGIALRLCMDRIAPPPRTETPPVVIPGLSEARDMSEKARLIVNATGDGIVSPDAAATLLGAIANAAKIIETEELAARIAALEVRDLI
jgi:hypothetical protein